MKNRVATRVVLWFCGYLVLVCLFACSGRQSYLLDLVPSDSSAVLVVDWQSVLANDDLKRLLRAEQFDGVLQRFGLERSSVKTLAVFSAMNSQVKAGMFLQGSFDRQKQIAAFKTHGWREELVDGYKVYVSGADHAVMLQNNILFVGTREGATAVFQARNNPRTRFTSSDAYKKIRAGMAIQTSTVKAFLVIPQGTLDMADAALETTAIALSLFNLGGVGALLKQITIAHGLGLSIGRSANQLYPVEMCILMRDERTAALVNGSLNLLKGFSSSTTTNDPNEQALRSMNISRAREVLSVKMTVPQSVLFPPSAR